MKKSNLRLNLFLGLFMLVGLALLGLGIFYTVDRNKKMNAYETVEGGIIDYIKSEGENGTVYGAVYAYIVDGKEYTVSDETFTNKVPRVGERVQIMYDPAAPENAFNKDAVSHGFALLIIGGMFFVIPFLFLLSINFTFSGGRLTEALKNFLLGLLFAGIGFGLCFGLKQGINFVTVFCFVFGCIGIYGIGYSVYILFKPETEAPKQDSLGNENVDLQQNYAVPDETFQDNNITERIPGEYKEKIERAANVINTGVNIVRAVQRIIGGLLFAGIGGTVIGMVMNPKVEVVGMPKLYVALFFGIFVIMGVIQIIRGIKEILRK